MKIQTMLPKDLLSTCLVLATSDAQAVSAKESESINVHLFT